MVYNHSGSHRCMGLTSSMPALAATCPSTPTTTRHAQLSMGYWSLTRGPPTPWRQQEHHLTVGGRGQACPDSATQYTQHVPSRHRS
jgi:hypothetical protein